MGNCVTYLCVMEIVSKLLRTLTNVFSDANLFSNLVTIDLLSELYLMVFSNSNSLAFSNK